VARRRRSSFTSRWRMGGGNAGLVGGDALHPCRGGAGVVGVAQRPARVECEAAVVECEAPRSVDLEGGLAVVECEAGRAQIGRRRRVSVSIWSDMWRRWREREGSGETVRLGSS
jgi:hypothetical protein